MIINNKELSKIKHIYHVYEDNNHFIHCEKYPIVYINRLFVYYKTPGSEELSHREISNVHQLCNSEWVDNYSSRISALFWDIDSEFLSENKIRSEKYKLINAINEAKNVRNRYEKIKEEMFKKDFIVNKLRESQTEFSFKSGDIWHNKEKDEYWCIINHCISDKFLLGRTCYLAKEYTSKNVGDGLLTEGFVITYDCMHNMHYDEDKLIKYGNDVEDAYPDNVCEKVYHLSDEKLFNYLTKSMERERNNHKSVEISM